MNAEKYRRNVELLCPTCGGTQFSQPEEEVSDVALIACIGCGLQTTKAELISSNAESIQAYADEMKKEIVKDVGKELKKMLTDTFKGNKFIKIR